MSPQEILDIFNRMRNEPDAEAEGIKNDKKVLFEQLNIIEGMDKDKVSKPDEQGMSYLTLLTILHTHTTRIDGVDSTKDLNTRTAKIFNQHIKNGADPNITAPGKEGMSALNIVLKNERNTQSLLIMLANAGYKFPLKNGNPIYNHDALYARNCQWMNNFLPIDEEKDPELLIHYKRGVIQRYIDRKVKEGKSKEEVMMSLLPEETIRDAGGAYIRTLRVNLPKLNLLAEDKELEAKLENILNSDPASKLDELKEIRESIDGFINEQIKGREQKLANLEMWDDKKGSLQEEIKNLNNLKTSAKSAEHKKLFGKVKYLTDTLDIENSNTMRIADDLYFAPMRFSTREDYVNGVNLNEEMQKEFDDLTKDFVKNTRSVLPVIKDSVMTAHAFGLDGEATFKPDPDKDPISFDLTGNSVYRTLPHLNESFKEFSKNMDTNAPDEYSKALLNAVKEAFEQANKAMYDRNYKDLAQDYMKNKPVIIPTYWEGHAASAVLYKDKIYLANKGGHTTVPSIKEYSIGNKDYFKSDNGELDINKITNFIEQASTFQRKSSNLPQWIADSVIGQGIGAMTTGFREGVYKDKDLKLKLEKVERINGQKVGNCAYTNTKRAAEMVMIALTKDAADDNKLKNVDVDVRQLYKKFSEHDRKYALDKYVEHMLKDGGEANKALCKEVLIQVLAQKNELTRSKRESGEKVVEKLHAMGMSDEDIVKAVLETKQPFKERFGRITRRLEESLFGPDRKNSFDDLKTLLLPGGNQYREVTFLKSVGLVSENYPTIKSLFFKEPEQQVKNVEVEQAVDNVNPSPIDLIKASMSQEANKSTPTPTQSVSTMAEAKIQQDVNSFQRPEIKSDLSEEKKQISQNTQSTRRSVLNNFASVRQGLEEAIQKKAPSVNEPQAILSAQDQNNRSVDDLKSEFYWWIKDSSIEPTGIKKFDVDFHNSLSLEAALAMVTRVSEAVEKQLNDRSSKCFTEYTNGIINPKEIEIFKDKLDNISEKINEKIKEAEPTVEFETRKVRQRL